MSTTTQTLYDAIMRLAPDDGSEFSTSYRELQDETGITNRHELKAALDRLVSDKAIEVVVGKAGAKTKIRLLDSTVNCTTELVPPAVINGSKVVPATDEEYFLQGLEPPPPDPLVDALRLSNERQKELTEENARLMEALTAANEQNAALQAQIRARDEAETKRSEQVRQDDKELSMVALLAVNNVVETEKQVVRATSTALQRVEARLKELEPPPLLVDTSAAEARVAARLAELEAEEKTALIEASRLASLPPQIQERELQRYKTVARTQPTPPPVTAPDTEPQPAEAESEIAEFVRQSQQHIFGRSDDDDSGDGWNGEPVPENEPPEVNVAATLERRRERGID